MRKHACIIILLSLGILSAMMPNVVGEDPSLDGNISFQPNMIPELQIHFVEEFFRFQWLENRFDLKLSVFFDGRLHSLKDFCKDNKINKHDVINRGDWSIEFGYLVYDIPQMIADNVDFLVWKIEGASFDAVEIEVEEIDSFVDLGYNITRFYLPDNLVLSYEDLWLYNFTISHPNKHETIVKGVHGRTSWNLDPITFSGGVITITGYSTEGGACSHNDIYNAMLNSTFQKTGNQYYSNAQIVIGDGANTTWFVDTLVQVEFNSSVFTANYDMAYQVTTNSNLRFGVLADASNKIGRDGVDVYMQVSGYLLGQHMIYGGSGSDVQLYACHLVDNHITWSYSSRITIVGTAKIYTTLIESIEIWGMSGGTIDVFEVTGTMFSSNRGQCRISLYGGTFTIDRVNFYLSGQCIQFYFGYGGTVNNLYQSGNTYRVLYCQGIVTDAYIVNGDLDAWTFYWYGVSTAEVYRQYTFDLTVTFPNGTAINGATVTIKHYGQTETEDYSGTTDANGQIAQQTLNMGFYNQTGSDTIYSYNPHELNITYSGMQTYTKNFTFADKTEWIIALQEETAAGYNWFAVTIIIGLFACLAFIMVLTTKH